MARYNRQPACKEDQKIRKKFTLSRSASDGQDLPLEEYQGQSDNRDILSMSKSLHSLTAKQRDAFLGDMKNKVEERRKGVGNLLLQKTEEILQEDARLRTVFVLAAADSLRRNIPNDGAPLEPNTTKDITSHMPIHQMPKSLINSSKDLIKLYDNLCLEISKSWEECEPVDKEWDDDCVKLNSLIIQRRNHTKQHLDSMMQEKGNAAKESLVDSPLATKESIWTTFGGGQSTEGRDSVNGGDWAQAASRAEKGVRRLVKNLPEDEN